MEVEKDLGFKFEERIIFLNNILPNWIIVFVSSINKNQVSRQELTNSPMRVVRRGKASANAFIATPSAAMSALAHPIFATKKRRQLTIAKTMMNFFQEQFGGVW